MKQNPSKDPNSKDWFVDPAEVWCQSRQSIQIPPFLLITPFWTGIFAILGLLLDELMLMSSAGFGVAVTTWGVATLFRE